MRYAKTLFHEFKHQFVTQSFAANIFHAANKAGFPNDAQTTLLKFKT